MLYLRTWIILVLAALLAGSVEANESTATVVSTEDSGPYTYVQLDIGGSNVWYAVPATKLKPGEQVMAPPGMPMKNFYSQTLDRTFELVYFADGIQGVESGGQPGNLPAGHPPVQTGLPPGHPSIQTNLPPGHPSIQTMLPAGHPPIGTSSNSACCAMQEAPASCCASTNGVAQ